jgi:hypothetical protein
LGTILKLFGRDEYQTNIPGSGNLPHLHILRCTKEKITSQEGKDVLECLVRGCAGDIIREDEIPALIVEGLLTDHEEPGGKRCFGTLGQRMRR